MKNGIKIFNKIYCKIVFLSITFITIIFLYGCINNSNRSDLAIIDNDESVVGDYEIENKNDEYVVNDNANKNNDIDILYFAGDIYFSKKVKDAYDEKGLKGIIDKNYFAFLQNGDFNIANLECAITNSTASEASKTYTFYTPEKYVKVMKKVGFDAMSIANNHVLDYGKGTFINTMNVLRNNDIQYVGGGINEDEAKRPLIKIINGRKYAIFAASYVLPNDKWKANGDNPGVNNGYNIAAICREIKKIKNEVDKVIVYMHWGEELEYFANSKQIECAHRLVDYGADLVVGAHPHVIQEIEYYKNVPIVYSLGNFIYGATKRETMLLEATFNYYDPDNDYLQLRIYPGLSNYEYVKYYFIEEDLKAKCDEIQKRCKTCYIGDNGYVFTVEQVEEALKNMATSSEVKFETE